MPPWTYPHVLWWVPAAVHPLEGKHAGLRPHQPPLNAFKVYTRWGGPGGHRQHLRPEIRAKEGRRGWGFHTHEKMRLQGVRSLFARGGYLPAVAPAQWRDKDEELYMPVEHAAYLAKPDIVWYSLQSKHKKVPLSQHRVALWRPAVEAPLELPKRRWGQRQNYVSDRTLPPDRSPRLHPDPSPGQRDAGQGRRGPDLPQLLSMEWPDGVDAWGGTRSAQCPALPWKLSSTGSRVEASRSSVVATRDSRPLSPEKCPTTGSARLHSNLLTTMKR